MKPKPFQARVASLEPTPPEIFFGRREFLKTLSLGMLAAPNLVCSPAQNPPAEDLLRPPIRRPDVFPSPRNPAHRIPEPIEPALTPREVAAAHNNFYEFLPGQGGPVWRYTGDFQVEPWKLEVTGECHKPGVFDLDDLFLFEHEERLYHFRCVERWAMNVPWSGFALHRLLERVEPKSSARFVRFVSAKVPEQMPGVRSQPRYPWPYHEGLRMDEAMHDLTLVVTGIYGQPLLKQHGAPVRIVVPWKYGYKSPKSVVRIELTRRQPAIFWQIQAHEYGFLSNVNPNIPHPRWSQERSYWLGRERDSFPTPIFNGYQEYVADLYPDEPRTPQRALRPGQTAR